MIVELVLAAVVAFAAGIGGGYMFRRSTAEKAIGTAEAQARKIVEEAEAKAESRGKEIVQDAKEDVQRLR